jgi:hypothetical protein
MISSRSDKENTPKETELTTPNEKAESNNIKTRSTVKAGCTPFRVNTSLRQEFTPNKIGNRGKELDLSKFPEVFHQGEGAKQITAVFEAIQRSKGIEKDVLVDETLLDKDTVEICVDILVRKGYVAQRKNVYYVS